MCKEMPHYFEQYIHKALQTVAEYCRGWREARKVVGFRKRLIMLNGTEEIQSITSVLQNAVTMPVASYIRAHFVQSC